MFWASCAPTWPRTRLSLRPAGRLPLLAGEREDRSGDRDHPRHLRPHRSPAPSGHRGAPARREHRPCRGPGDPVRDHRQATVGLRANRTLPERLMELVRLRIAFHNHAKGAVAQFDGDPPAPNSWRRSARTSASRRDPKCRLVAHFRPAGRPFGSHLPRPYGGGRRRRNSGGFTPTVARQRCGQLGLNPRRGQGLPVAPLGRYP